MVLALLIIGIVLGICISWVWFVCMIFFGWIEIETINITRKPGQSEEENKENNNHVLTKKELWEKCGNNEPITLEDLGIPEWRRNTDGLVYMCGGYTIYKTPEGYRHCTGEFVTPSQKKRYGLQ